MYIIIIIMIIIIIIISRLESSVTYTQLKNNHKNDQKSKLV